MGRPRRALAAPAGEAPFLPISGATPARQLSCHRPRRRIPSASQVRMRRSRSCSRPEKIPAHREVVALLRRYRPGLGNERTTAPQAARRRRNTINGSCVYGSARDVAAPAGAVHTDVTSTGDNATRALPPPAKPGDRRVSLVLVRRATASRLHCNGRGRPSGDGRQPGRPELQGAVASGSNDRDPGRAAAAETLCGTCRAIARTEPVSWLTRLSVPLGALRYPQLCSTIEECGFDSPRPRGRNTASPRAVPAT